MPKVSKASRTSGLRISADASSRSLDLGSHFLTYRLVRSLRRTIAIHVGAGGVETRAPMTASLADIESFMRRKGRWIVSHLARYREAGSFDWRAGSRLPLLGSGVTLQAAPECRGILLDESTLLIGSPRRGARADWRPRVIAWIREQALRHFEQRAAALAAPLEVPVPAVRLSNAAGRWGSCSVRGQTACVRLHWKLYLLQPHLIDYVVTHELAHLRELNHSARFWALVAVLCPDYAALRKELNQRGRELPAL
jgi:predicted metal-dependent hydrolase